MSARTLIAGAGPLAEVLQVTGSTAERMKSTGSCAPMPRTQSRAISRAPAYLAELRNRLPLSIYGLDEIDEAHPHLAPQLDPLRPDDLSLALSEPVIDECTWFPM